MNNNNNNYNNNINNNNCKNNITNNNDSCNIKNNNYNSKNCNNYTNDNISKKENYNDLYSKGELRQLRLEQNKKNIDNNNSIIINDTNMNSSDESDDSSWQEVPGTSKRTKTTNPGNEVKKINLGNNNRFSILYNEDNDAKKQEEDNKIPKPPPTFIPSIKNIRSMTVDLNKIVNATSYNYKSMKDGQIRLMVHDINSYRLVIKHLDQKNYTYHTYQPKIERAFRAVIKNIHHSTPVEEIKAELLNHGHDARYITNIKSRVTKEPLPMFFIDLEPKSNNKEIYNIKYINNAVVKIEPSRKFDDLIQCHRCQEFGHTKSFCRKQFRCVKCGLGHPSTDCTKSKDQPAQCTHCLQNHTANYKGCRVYQEILSRQKPTAVNNRQNENRQTYNTENRLPTPHYETHQNNGNSFSYADVTRSNFNQTSNTNDKLEKLLTKQIEMMNTLTNMMSTLMTKLCK